MSTDNVFCTQLCAQFHVLLSLLLLMMMMMNEDDVSVTFVVAILCDEHTRCSALLMSYSVYKIGESIYVKAM
jgi:hypothetical protein